MPTPAIPVEFISLDRDNVMRPKEPSRPSRGLAVRPFESTLEILNASSNKRETYLRDVNTGITYVMHSNEVRKMLIGGPPVANGAINGRWGFCRISTFVSLRYLGQPTKKIGFFDYLKSLAKTTEEHFQAFVNAHGACPALYWDRMPRRSGLRDAPAKEFHWQSKRGEWVVDVEAVVAVDYDGEKHDDGLLKVTFVSPEGSREFLLRPGEESQVIKELFDRVKGSTVAPKAAVASPVNPAAEAFKKLADVITAPPKPIPAPPAPPQAAKQQPITTMLRGGWGR